MCFEESLDVEDRDLEEVGSGALDRMVDTAALSLGPATRDLVCDLGEVAATTGDRLGIAVLSCERDCIFLPLTEQRVRGIEFADEFFGLVLAEVR